MAADTPASQQFITVLQRLRQHDTNRDFKRIK
jgi:hypothetical protein